jgi:hypothetical protein
VLPKRLIERPGKRGEQANSTSWRFSSLQHSSRLATSDGVWAPAVAATRDSSQAVVTSRPSAGT